MNDIPHFRLGWSRIQETGMKWTERAAGDHARTGLAVAMTAGAMDVAAHEMEVDIRSVKVVLARDLTTYATAAGFGMSYARLEAAFGGDRSSRPSAGWERAVQAD